MDKRIEEAMSRGEFVQGLDLPDEVYEHNWGILKKEFGIKDDEDESEPNRA